MGQIDADIANSAAAASNEPPFIPKTHAFIKDDEMTRIIIQWLNSRGLRLSSKTLEKESKQSFETQNIIQFRNAVLTGDWDTVERLIPMLDNNLQPEVEQRVQSLVKKQKFMELLERRQVKKALLVLRHEISPLSQDAAQLHELSSLMMCSSPEMLLQRSKWSGADGGSRQQLFEQLQEFFPSSLIIPENRLETLVEQALSYQKSNCLYHNATDDGITLFRDHLCQRSEFPCESRQVFEEHTDEVWYVQFSHDGLRLASASKDCTAIIWDVCGEGPWRPRHILQGHEEAVSFLAWSPDDSMLVTCSNDHKVRLWDTKTAMCRTVISRHVDAVTSCSWFPDNNRFVTSSLDKTIYLWDTTGTLLYRWLGARVTDLAISHDGEKMIAVCHEKKIRIYDLQERTEVCIQEDNSITSLCLSSDSRFALINVSAQEIHLWDLVEKRLVCKYTGQKQGRFVIRSSFGGANQSFIVSGSEDSNVYIWNRERTKLIEVLHGHSGTVNSVAWNPRDPSMFASASDDCTIRIWGKVTHEKQA